MDKLLESGCPEEKGLMAIKIGKDAIFIGNHSDLLIILNY